MKPTLHPRWLLLIASLTLLSGCTQPLASDAQPALSPTASLAAPQPSVSATPSAIPAVRVTPVDIPMDSPKWDHIQIQAVRRRSMPGAEVTAPGSVEANPNLISHVNLPVSGRVLRVLVRQGDPVQAGQPLLTVISPDATEAQAALRESEAALRRERATAIEARVGVTKARTSLRKAELDCQRVHDLFRHDAIAKKEVLYAETDLSQARSDLQTTLALVEQAQAGIDSARAVREQALSRLRILGVGANELNPEIIVKSPLTGKVLEMSVVAGEYHSDLGASVMTIVDLSSVWVTSSVPESDIRWVSVGEAVHISLDAFPGEKFDGRVARVADVLDPKTRTIKVMTELANPQGKFRPEMFGRIHHVHDLREMAVIPATAVLQGGDGNDSVYVQDSPGSFRPRRVKTGQREGNDVAVLEGLSPGEKVVVDGAMLLQR